MPELPEVETVRRQLKEKLNNRIIKKVIIYYNDIIAYPKIEEFKKQISNQKINDIKRRGKWLIFELDSYYLLSHLRMEGKYFFKKSSEVRNKHEHVVFILDNDVELRYHDTRKFGKMYLIEKDKINLIGPLIKLGLEPWDSNLDINYLKDKFKNKKLPIKTVLLDQSIIVGIGNIYADEILFLSEISPFKRACDLDDNQLRQIIENTKITLDKAIKLGGSTIHSYTSVDGMDGKFQNELLVHKDKSLCPNCKNEIKKVFIKGRGTYYCDKCQKL